MKNMKMPISFTVKLNSQVIELKTYSEEYRTLTMLLKDRLSLEGFGECGGMGRCVTCLIKVTGITGDSAIKERNEPVALSRRHYNDPTYRLSCQLYLSADLEGSVIEVVENQ